MPFEKMLARVDELKPEVIEVCSELIQRPSDHPAGNTVGCVNYIKDFCDERGLITDVYKTEEGKPNIVVRINGHSKKKIIWVGHNDVVPVGDLDKWKYPPFSGKIADGKIWGRGASDMKGSNASALVAAHVLSEFGSPHSVDFWFTADEEIGARAGVAWLAKEGLMDGDVTINGDSNGCTPGLINVGVGHKGGIGISLSATGKTAHGSTPYLGDNAVDKLLKIIPLIKSLSAYELEIPPDLKHIVASTTEFMLRDKSLNDEQRNEVERLFYYPSGPSLNILHGGVKGNVVPDQANASFDIRLTPGVDALKLKEHVENLVKEANVPGVTLNCRASEKVGYYERSDEPAVIAMCKAVREVTNVDPVLTLAPWATDSIFIKRVIQTKKHPDGIPNILYGPMLRDQLHQQNEHILVDNLVTGAKVYALFPYYY